MMKRILSLLLFFSLNSFAAISYGTGADGACSFTGGLQAKASWNCESLTVTGSNTFPGTSPVTIYVDGDVTISGTLDVSASGQTAGPGGGNGGNCNAGLCDQEDPPDSFGGEGSGGQSSTDQDASGPGGGGGQYSGIGTDATSGAVGQTSTGGTPGAIGAGGSGSFGNPATFYLSVQGGRGGGAGASGDDTNGSGNGFEDGGDGGGGGGAIVIVASGTIEVSGTINADGGAGSNGSALNGYDYAGGGGGGGSGGLIYIVSGESITLTGTSTLSVAGGANGNGGTPGGLNDGGDGGAGGDGWIRLEAPDGAITDNGVTSTYAFNLFSTGEPPSYLTGAATAFTSDIGVGCARTNMQDYQSYFLSLIMGFLLIMGLGLIPRRNH
jgi:hypothetical protein